MVDVEDVVTQHVHGEGHGCYLGFLDGVGCIFLNMRGLLELIVILWESVASEELGEEGGELEGDVVVVAFCYLVLTFSADSWPEGLRLFCLLSWVETLRAGFLNDVVQGVVVEVNGCGFLFDD